MDSTPQEKILIYQEEMKKKCENEEEQKKGKISALSQTERDQIVEELCSVPAYFLKDEDIHMEKHGQLTWIIIGTIFFIAWNYISLFLGIAILIGALIFLYYDTEHINYQCPYCNQHDMAHLTEDEKEEKEDFREKGYVDATCSSCKQQYRIYGDYSKIYPKN